MNALPLLLLAEQVKLFRRPAARLGLVVSGLLGVLMPLLLVAQIQASEALFGPGASAGLDPTPTQPMFWALTLRNFFVAQVFLIVLGAQTLAGEIGDRTLREGLLQPVSRSAVLLAKLGALLTFDAATLLLPFVVGAVLGAGAFGLDGLWTTAVLAYLLNLLSDAMLIALTVLVSVATRSTLATLGGLLITLIFDMVTRWVAIVVASGAIVRNDTIIWVAKQHPVLLNACLGLWGSVLPGASFDPRTLAATLGLGLGSTALALLLFQRSDIP